MTYNSTYFVDTYFPRYFQTVQKTEPLYRWVECGWYEAGWIDGLPCPVISQNSGGYGNTAVPIVKLYADDEAIMQVIMSFVTRNQNG